MRARRAVPDVGTISMLCSAGAAILFYRLCRDTWHLPQPLFLASVFLRALGFGTYKLTYGHRGINQPVMDLTTRRVEITAHNHGFAVDAPLEGTTTTDLGEAAVSHVCLNDDVVEGLELRDADGRLTSFSVQYHPEAAAGPHDAAYLFDRFSELMTERKGA